MSGASQNGLNIPRSSFLRLPLREVTSAKLRSGRPSCLPSPSGIVERATLLEAVQSPEVTLRWLVLWRGPSLTPAAERREKLIL